MKTRRWLAWALVCAGVGGLLLYSGVGAAIYVANRPDPEPFADDFEAGDLAQWESAGEVQRCCAHSMSFVAAPVRSGAQALLVTLRQTDDRVEGSTRAELRLRSAEFGRETWYTFSVFLPANWEVDDDPVTVAQWHAVPDLLLLERHQPPPFRITIVGDRWMLGQAWDENRVSALLWQGEHEIGHRLFWSGPLRRGGWADWVCRIRWSSGPDGLTECWLDGERVGLVEGANAYNDWLGPYFKLGIYIPRWTGVASGRVRERTLVFDRVASREGPADISDFVIAETAPR